MTELERLVVPTAPQLLGALVVLASTARHRRVRERAGRRLRQLVWDLAADAKWPDTFRGVWARRALVEHASAVVEYLTTCIEERAHRAKRT